MVHIIVGALAMFGFLALLNYTRSSRRLVTWWQWILTVLCFLYFVFVLEMVISFIQEGAPRAALVMGIVLGFAAIVWAVILARFVFFKQSQRMS